MTESDMRELSHQCRLDGKRLFSVSEILYKSAIVLNWIIAILGVIASGFSFKEGGFGVWIGIGILIVVGFVCASIYIVSVLSTHVAKVMVHTSYATMGVLENMQSGSVIKEKQ